MSDGLCITDYRCGEPPEDDVALKPCPFCGNAKPVYGPGYLRCAQCHSYGPYRSEYSWNDRAPAIPEELVEQLREAVRTIPPAGTDYADLEYCLWAEQAEPLLRRLLSAFEGDSQ